MISTLYRNAQAKRIMHETVADGFLELCNEVNVEARNLAAKFSNGAGEKLKESLVKPS